MSQNSLKKNSSCDKTQIVTKVQLWQNLNCDKTLKWQNSNCDQTEKLNLWKNSKTQIVTKLKTQIVTQLKLWQISIYDKGYF